MGQSHAALWRSLFAITKAGNLANVSLIATEEGSLPEFMDVYILLIGKQRSWVIRNENPDKNREPVLTIETMS